MVYSSISFVMESSCEMFSSSTVIKAPSKNSIANSSNCMVIISLIGPFLFQIVHRQPRLPYILHPPHQVAETGEICRESPLIPQMSAGLLMKNLFHIGY